MKLCETNDCKFKDKHNLFSWFKKISLNQVQVGALSWTIWFSVVIRMKGYLLICSELS